MYSKSLSRIEYVDVKGVTDILQELRDDEGLIVKDDLLMRIKLMPGSLKKPTIYKKSEIIHHITNYQNNAKLAGFQSSYKIFLGIKLVKLNLEKLNHKRIDLQVSNFKIEPKRRYSGWNYDYYFSNLEDIVPQSFIGSKNELAEVLKVSRPTINHWVEIGIIKKYTRLARLIINGKIYYPFAFDQITFYNLDHIKLKLKDL